MRACTPSRVGEPAPRDHPHSRTHSYNHPVVFFLCCCDIDAANIGTLLGSFVGVFIRAILTDEQLVSWGWRLPFLSGIFIGFVSAYLELHGTEHNPNVGDENDHGAGEGQSLKHSLGDVFKRENLPALASATLTPMLYGAGFYTSESGEFGLRMRPIFYCMLTKSFTISTVQYYMQRSFGWRFSWKC